MAESQGIFLADFEDGTLSALTAITQEGSNTFAINTSSPLHGSYQVRATFDGTNNDCYGYKTFTTTSTVYARCYFKLDSSFDGNTGSFFPFSLRFGSSGINHIYLRCAITSGNVAATRFYHYTDAGAAYIDISQAISKNTPHYYELSFRASSAAGANDGLAELYFDGVRIAAATNVDSDTIALNRVYAGQFGTLIPTNGSYIDIDDIKVDSSYIGPYSTPYICSGGIQLTGAATTSKTDNTGDYEYVASGGILFSGEATTINNADYSYVASGGIQFSGAATTSEEVVGEYSYTGSGGIKFSGASSTVGYVLVADHTFVEKYSTIPQTYIDEVKKMWFGTPGESHSLAYPAGLELLESADSKFQVNVTTTGTPEKGTSSYLRACRGAWGDYTHTTDWRYLIGEEDWYTNSAAVAQIKTFLQYAYDNDFELSVLGFGWCWDMTWHNAVTTTKDSVYKCGWAGSSVAGPEDDLQWGLDADDTAITGNSVCMDTYLNATKEYIDYCRTNSIPTKVIYTTGPVDGYTGENGYQRHVKHTYLRAYVNNNGGYLLDYADILAWDNAGSERTLSWTDGEGGSHSYQMIATDNLLNLDGSDGSSNPYHIGERGALRLAKASWVMMAYMAGWDGTPAGEYTASGGITFSGSASTENTKNYEYSSSSGIVLSGNCESLYTVDYSYSANSGIVYTGAGETSYTIAGVNFEYVASGGITFSGISDSEQYKNYVYEANNGIVFASNSSFEIGYKNYVYEANNGIVFVGNADTEYTTPDSHIYIASGGITFSGSSDQPRKVAGLLSNTFSIKKPSMSLSSKLPSISFVGKN